MRSVVEKLVAEARLIADEDVGRNKGMARNGAEWLISRLAITPERLDSGKVNVCVLHRYIYMTAPKVIIKFVA